MGTHDCPQQHVKCTGTPIYLSRGNICKYGSYASQHTAYCALQDRTSVARSQAFTVDDPDASDVSFESVRKEHPRHLLRLWHRKPVQVDFRLDSVLTTAELAQDCLLDALAGKDQLFPARELGVTNVGVQALLQHRVPIRTGKACAWRWPASRSHRRRVESKGLDVSHRLAKEVSFILIELGVHATSAK